MSHRRRIATALGLAAVGTLTTLAIGATPAQAAINPANCTLYQVDAGYEAVCTDYTPGGGSPWHLELSCQRGTHFYNADGSNAYGTSYSIASCGSAGNIDTLGWSIVNI